MTSLPTIAGELAHEWNRCAATGAPLALLLVSPDQPESLTDAEFLARLERSLRVHCARSRDVVLARPAGCFAAVLPDTTPAGARRVGEQIVEAMRRRDDPATVSVGVAVCEPDDLHAPADLVRRVESLLRSSHDHGGDRCTGAGSRAAPTPSAFAWLKSLFHPARASTERRRRG